MAQTKDGAIKVAAKKAGITTDEYISKVESGLKRCTKCKTWKSRDDFGTDNSRSDKKDSKCANCQRVPDPYSSLRGRVSTFKGMKHTDEAKRKMGERKKGKKLRLGKKHTIETRSKISCIVRERTPRGERVHNYVDGKSAERYGIRHTSEYKRWRYDVFLRDGFVCQMCGYSKGGILNAHHIKPFPKYPELRFELSNGITLCESCHKKQHAKDDCIVSS